MLLELILLAATGMSGQEYDLKIKYPWEIFARVEACTIVRELSAGTIIFSGYGKLNTGWQRFEEHDTIGDSLTDVILWGQIGSAYPHVYLFDLNNDEIADLKVTDMKMDGSCDGLEFIDQTKEEVPNEFDNAKEAKQSLYSYRTNTAS